MALSDKAQTAIQEAVNILRQGGLVAMPTETVYGLAADASNPEAIQKLYAVKGRPSAHPVIVHIGDMAQLSDWAIDIPDAAVRLAEQHWPGPLTLILQKHPRVSAMITGGQASIGIRIPQHPLALGLLREFKGGLAAPSANRFGRVSPTSAEHVREDLGTDVDLVIDGGVCPVGIESTIVSFLSETPVILRPGMLALDYVLGSGVQAPGTLKSHYAPQKPVTLFTDETPPATAAVLRAGSTATAYARDLYAWLREADASDSTEIWIERVPERWAAISDRLKRIAYRENEHV